MQWFDRGMSDPPEELADIVLRMMGETLHPRMGMSEELV